MRIAIADNNSRKFTQDLIEHWLGQGHEIMDQHPDHEVKFEPGASEKLAQWADIYYIDTWDANVSYLYNLYHGKQEIDPTLIWDNNKKPKIVVRALDWEVWLGYARDQQIIDWVDKVICIAPHIEKELRDHGNFGDKLKLIKPGVNLDKFTLKTKQTDGFQLGMVLGDLWPGVKNHMAGLDIFTTLYRQDNRWRLHIRGQHERGEYWPVMYNYYLESRGIKDVVTLYGPQEDMNAWYENIDILLHPGQKEAFCYAVAEAMAKGIPAVVNDFYGRRDIWPIKSVYQTHEEAVRMISGASIFKGQSCREIIEQDYSLERYLKETDEWIGI